ncbi:polysaccharide biosynthesis/export family protein [Aurantiacibacter sp. D1-12]|uniref:polysaccharide biosynthesis/export family protein n=1 Tax=Aurantiacibacter sp. D1-12 TaxID=2993658 RepID=UPI00237C8D88|nr:polysaccharide biosynthesis/export family protein [Aurantiacibacter sp. D1-12]MDE1468295.1 polysaccharide export protein [Aurantiacibacter sp. D1-12]
MTACASQPPLGGAPDVSVSQAELLPIPGLTDMAVPAETGLIRPMDVIQIDVFGIADLSREVQVGANGNIDFPLVGSVAAVGLTTEDLSGVLEDRLRNAYVRDPDVTSRITERTDQLMTITGEVARPGRFAIAAPITLMEAVAMGGGLDEYADSQEVLIFRTVGDERYIGVYNLEGIQRGNYADPTVYPTDIVMVGDSPGRRRLQEVLGVVSAITSPLILIERALR